MQQDQPISLRFLQALLLIFLAAALSACAGRPKPINPSQPYTVTEVRVIADRIENSYFAERLQTRLEASLGRATADVGQTSSLRIRVLDRREDRSPVYFLGGMSQSVSLDLTLVDSNSGQVLLSKILNLSFMDFNGSNAETVLISRLTDDIRHLLGLSGYTSYPVSGAKRDVVRPASRPADGDVSSESRSVDPLLNGTVTPTTMVLDAEPQTAPVIDYTKPLLEARSAVKPAVPASAVTPAAMVADDADLDEPCVITLENDCSDPGSQ